MLTPIPVLFVFVAGLFRVIYLYNTRPGNRAVLFPLYLWKMVQRYFAELIAGHYIVARRPASGRARIRRVERRFRL